jgi:ubiquinone/menaquinone biosynthesis C-methylase UbiE
MSDDLQSQIEAAKAYEALFVPALFAQWAPRVAAAAELQDGERVLDVACGTGVLAREARRRTGARGYVAGLDPAPGMLAVAEALAPSVQWRRGLAESLPFPDETFDAVVSQFGLMFMHRDAAVREMLRALKPGGRVVVAVWDSADRIPAYAAEIALLERRAGGRAADALRAPFALGDRDALTSIFERAGARDIAAQTVRGEAVFPSIRAMVEADLRGWLPVMGVNLDEAAIADVLAGAPGALGPCVVGDDPIRFAVSAHILSARKA